MVLPASGIEPVTADEVAIGVEAAEDRIGEHRLPDIVLELHPVGDDLRALDLDLLAGRGLIDDALPVGGSSSPLTDTWTSLAEASSDVTASRRVAICFIDRIRGMGFPAPRVPRDSAQVEKDWFSGALITATWRQKQKRISSN